VAAHIPGAELVEIEGAGHIIPAEQAENFYRTIDHFLSRQDATTN
jgi:pimeloyl-ACP methyl ester carboxylesterase